MRAYGWRPSLPDFRDAAYKALPRLAGQRPPVFSMRSAMPSVWDQEQENSCVGHGVSAIWSYSASSPFMPARNFIYYNARDAEGDTGSDNGATVRDGVAALVRLGVCSEDAWIYQASDVTARPYPGCYRAALPQAGGTYHPVGNDSGATIDEICDQLAGGEPIVFGISVFQSFETEQVAKTGIVPMPHPGEKDLGGHCIVMVGYDDARQSIECRNSWGPDWGDHGYFWLPYAYASSPSFADDYWVYRAINGR